MIPIAKPYFDALDEEWLVQPLKTGWVVQGPKVREFEAAVAAYTGAPAAAATSSCTTALHLALLALGIGPGDDVVVPAFTFVATANAVEHAGARPVFADVDLATFNVGASHVRAVLTGNTRAVIPVHLFGLCADMDSIAEVAGASGLAVIEDAACALGAFDRGRHAGTMGDAGCLSFHARKVITTGEGGMVLARTETIAQQVRALRDHGTAVDDFRRHSAGHTLLPDYPWAGFNYRMTDIQASLGLAQRRKLGWLLERRAAVAARYDERLREIDWLQIPASSDGRIHAYQSYVCLFRPELPTIENVEALAERRRALMRRLRQQGVDTRQGTHAVHLLQYYAGRYKLAPEEFPNALVADRLSLALPLYPQLSEAEQDQVVEALRTLGP